MKSIKYLFVSLAVAALCSVAAFAATCPDCGDYKYYLHSTRFATCTTAGYDKYLCYTCNYSDRVSRPIDPDAHNTIEVERVEPTFGSNGYVLERCSYCGYDIRTVLEADMCAHRYKEDERIDATVDSLGSVIYICRDCGHTYTETLEYVPSIPETTAALGKAVFNGVWGMTNVYVPGFNFTIRQLWIGTFLCSFSVIVIRLLLGIGGSGVSSRTSSTNQAKISENRKGDEY